MSALAFAVLDAYMTGYGWLDSPTKKDCRGVAAALRAAADQVVPDQQEPASSPHMGNFITNAHWRQCQAIRTQLLAIADELEAQ
jgi:hypothetical protein